MTENDENKKTIYEDEKKEEKDGETTITRRKSIMEVNPDGSTKVTDSVISSTIKNEIKLDENTKVNVEEVEAELDDQKYINAMRTKNQLAVLKGTNQMICLLALSSAENILKKMGCSLEQDFSIFAFGIYSLEEINEIRKSMQIDKLKPKPKENFTKDFYVLMPPINRINRNKKTLNNIIFKNVQAKLDFIKAEEERKKREEEEKKRKLEEANKKILIEKEKRKKKACYKIKKIRNDNRLEILMKKFKQYRNNCEQLRIIEHRRKMETEKKVLRLKMRKSVKEGKEVGEGPQEGENADENPQNNDENDE